MAVIFTIGHSTRTIEEFLGLLEAHRIRQLADVRTMPGSRRHPHFSGEALARTLGEAGITYRHFRALGGLRKPRRDSTNTAWRNDSFRGYADYMETAAFAQAVDELVAWAGGGMASDRRDDDPARRTVIMCAEAVWWRCHRQLIADALVARGIEVRHITSAAPPAEHRLTEFARVQGDRVTYPGLV